MLKSKKLKPNNKNKKKKKENKVNIDHHFYCNYWFQESKSSLHYLASFKALFTDETFAFDMRFPVECFYFSKRFQHLNAR